jgi:hypothetical protein
MNNRRYKFVYLLLGFGVVAGLLTAFAWTFRGALLEGLIRDRLASKGIIVSKIEVETVNPWRIDIRNFHLGGNVSMQSVEAEIEWRGMLAPRLARLSFSGLMIELGVTPSGMDWRGLTPLMERGKATDQEPKPIPLTDWPALNIRDAAIKALGEDGTVSVHATLNSLSFEPLPDGAVGNGAKSGAHLAAELKLLKLRAKGWELIDGAIAVSGKITWQGDGLHYRPMKCDRLSLARLVKDNIVVSGPISACVGPGKAEHAVSIDREGRIATDMEAKIDDLALSLGVGTLPPVRISTQGGVLSVRQPLRQVDGAAGGVALRELNLVLPGYALALDGTGLSVSGGKAGKLDPSLAIEINVDALRHTSPVPALAPLNLRGAGEITPKTQTMTVTLRQPSPGLSAEIRLDRENAGGEGTLSFDMHPLVFDESRLRIGQVSPLLANYVESTGGIHASGKILFNDTWATPLNISGRTEDLAVVFRRTLLSTEQRQLVFTFGRSLFKASLPLQVPGKGRLDLDLVDGGLRLGGDQVHGLTGNIYFQSLWPLICQRRQQQAEPEQGSDAVLLNIVSCLENAFADARIKPSKAKFDRIITGLRQALSGKKP